MTHETATLFAWTLLGFIAGYALRFVLSKGHAAYHRGTLELYRSVTKELTATNRLLIGGMTQLKADNERMRKCLQGVSGCSTCEVCNGAASRTLGLKTDAQTTRDQQELFAP